MNFQEAANLYCSHNSADHIFQWNITSNIASVINATRQQIYVSSAQTLGALQMGPDGKIYVAHYGTKYLGAINNPDSAGASCNYLDSAIFLGTGISTLGLPNFITSYFLPTGINTSNPQQNQLTISPNPATDKINISFPVSSSQTITTKIFSVTGEVVFESPLTPKGGTKMEVPLGDLGAGIYFLSVQGEKELITKKIVVNH